MNRQAAKLTSGDGPCPCKSGWAYAACCGPVHADIRVARKPEQVVRARYSAQVLGETDFFRESIIREHRTLPQVDEFLGELGHLKYESITVTESTRTGWLQRKATVLCRIYAACRKRVSVHTERIHLKREDHAWRVVTVDLVTHRPETTVGRNAPCPCGSGRKYKRCCGGRASALSAGKMNADHKNTSIQPTRLIQ